jgi:hypothetical protein
LERNWKGRRAQTNASPVSIAEAVRLAKGTAALIGQFTGGDYGEPARGELNVGESLAEEKLGNPVAFAHTIIDWYALSTGDLLHGTAEVSREGHGLAFSPAAVARAACEYAQITSWLAEPDISLEVRMARTAHLCERSIRESRKNLTAEEFSEYESQHARYVSWVRRTLSSRQRLAGPTDRFKAADPVSGQWHYSHLSDLAHGGLIAVAETVEFARADDREMGALERLWKVLLPCSYALAMNERLSLLRGRSSSTLDGLQLLYQDYVRLLEPYETELRSRK